MNRRDLFLNLARINGRDVATDETPRVMAGGIDAYTTPLTLADVYHLMRRMGFAATVPQAKGFVGMQAADVVDALMGNDDQPPSPGTWTDQITENPLGADQQTRAAIEKSWEINHGKLANWWVQLMVQDTTVREKLTAFWSGHWTTEYTFDEMVSVPQTLFRQLATLRRMRLGGMREMALELTVDNAMVMYLGGHHNEVGKPNENYARELLELFTTGIGWYTEGDVREAARVLTGWKSSRFNDEAAPNQFYNVWFNATKHDVGQKRFMGQDIAARTPDNNTEYQVKMEEVYELIKIIFRERADAASRFIAEKFYRFYVYSSAGNVDTPFVRDLAAVFSDADFSIRALVRALFSSQAFFDAGVRGAQIKTPLEYVVGMQRQLGLVYTDQVPWLAAMDQVIMDPPNVAGWPGYRSWISTNTYPIRRQYAMVMVAAMSDAQIQAFIKFFDDHNDVRAFVRGVVLYLLPMPVTQAREDFYVSTLLQNAPDYEWPGIVADTSTAGVRVRSLLTTISKAPDFNLC